MGEPSRRQRDPRGRPRGAAVAALAIALASHAARPSAARAGGLVVTGGSPRAIGRAGTGTVGDDGGGALLVNPAALARRDGVRVQLGIAASDDELSWDPGGDAPIARDQSATSLAPCAAAIGSWGPWVLAAAGLTAAAGARELRDPGDVDGGLEGRFEYRYAGIAGELRRDAIALGAARRIGDTLAIGLSLTASRVAVLERRRLWAGFSGRDEVGSPAHDLEIAFAGRDGFVAGAALGVLLAPEDAPLELGASLAWSQDVAITTRELSTAGTAVATRTAFDATARLALRQPWTARAGARYLTDHVVVELGGDLWLAPPSAAAAAWRVAGLSVVDPSGVETAVARVPSRISLRTHGAVRASAEVELVPGFLWATAGYAYAVGGTSAARLSPTFGDLGGHTAALGLEATAGGFTVTAGWSRTWAASTRWPSALALDNPFGAGDAAAPDGRYDGSSDRLGLMVEAELDSAP